MKIEIWSDFVCPFCYLGKRKLEKALSEFEHKSQVQVIFKSYLLSPDAPLTNDKVGYEGFAQSKGVSLSQAKEMLDSVADRVKPYGLNYDMSKIQSTSTLKAHRLAKWARSYKKEKALTEVFMDAHFTKGANLSDDDTLLNLVERVGLDKLEALSVLESNAFLDVVTKERNEASQLGVRGVPFFVFDRKFAISGAQPDEVFTNAIKKAFEEASPFEMLDQDDEELCSPEEGCGF